MIFASSTSRLVIYIHRITSLSLAIIPIFHDEGDRITDICTDCARDDTPCVYIDFWRGPNTLYPFVVRTPSAQTMFMNVNINFVYAADAMTHSVYIELLGGWG